MGIQYEQTRLKGQMSTWTKLLRSMVDLDTNYNCFCPGRPLTLHEQLRTLVSIQLLRHAYNQVTGNLMIQKFLYILKFHTLIEWSFWFDTKNLGWSIVFIEKSQDIFSK